MVYFLCKAYDSDRQNCYFALSLPVRGAWIEIRLLIPDGYAEEGSLPVRGAWIEIITSLFSRRFLRSLPVRGAWIEISDKFRSRQRLKSLPVRGAWIEIRRTCDSAERQHVAPRAGSVD